MNDLLFISAGMLTTVQDLGRKSFRHHGVPLSGSMDQGASILANQIVGNVENTALLECTMLGPKIQFNVKTTIAITGAKVDCYINKIDVSQNEKIECNKNDILSFGKIRKGCRFYIAFNNGIKTSRVLGSCSSDLSTNIGLPSIRKGSFLALNDSQEKNNFNINHIQCDYSQKAIRVYRGPEYNIIDNKCISGVFHIDPASNRMAYLLSSRNDYSHTFEMISSAVLPGTIQLTPSGQFIILMRDAQTTGGYPRIFQVCQDDLDVLAQKRGGEGIEFEIIDY